MKDDFWNPAPTGEKPYNNDALNHRLGQFHELVRVERLINDDRPGLALVGDGGDHGKLVMHPSIRFLHFLREAAAPWIVRSAWLCMRTFKLSG